MTDAAFVPADFVRCTVLAPGTDEVIGCVCIYAHRGHGRDTPDARDGRAAQVRSWVCADHAELDAELARAVTDWLAERWPFARVEYAMR